MDFMPILKAALSIFVGLIAGNLISELLEHLLIDSRLGDKMKVNKQVLILFSAASRYILILIGFIVDIAQFGVSEVVFQIFSLILVFVVMVILIYSLKDIISNMLAGHMLFSQGMIEVGDILEINGFSGRVLKITSVSIEIETDDNSKIILPNYFLVNRKIIKKTNVIKKQG